MNRERCLWCESERLENGKLEGTGRVYFKADHAKFLVLATSEVDLRARVCVDCGYIDLYADTEKLKRILKMS